MQIEPRTVDLVQVGYMGQYGERCTNTTFGGRNMEGGNEDKRSSIKCVGQVDYVRGKRWNGSEHDSMRGSGGLPFLNDGQGRTGGLVEAYVSDRDGNQGSRGEGSRPTSASPLFEGSIDSGVRGRGTLGRRGGKRGKRGRRRRSGIVRLPF